MYRADKVLNTIILYWNANKIICGTRLAWLLCVVLLLLLLLYFSFYTLKFDKFNQRKYNIQKYNFRIILVLSTQLILSFTLKIRLT